MASPNLYQVSLNLFVFFSWAFIAECMGESVNLFSFMLFCDDVFSARSSRLHHRCSKKVFQVDLLLVLLLFISTPVQVKMILQK